jgi:hypothetical protein
VSSELTSSNSITSSLGNSDEYTTRIEYLCAKEVEEGAYDGSSLAWAEMTAQTGRGRREDVGARRG